MPVPFRSGMLLTGPARVDTVSLAMGLHVVVAVKQVPDPEVPRSAFGVDRERKTFILPPGTRPVVNGFDEHAVEASLRLKDSLGARVTVVSMGAEFTPEVIKRPLAMGADDLVLLQDPAFADVHDSTFTAHVLARGIRRLEPYDLVLCGRQASDWDNAQVPLILAEMLGLPCITLARAVQVHDRTVRVERVVPGGVEVAETELPALVTVSNELGQPRFPTVRGTMTASRKRPTVWSASDLGLDPASIPRPTSLLDLYIPEEESACRFIEADTDEEKGRLLARALREEGLV